MVLALVIALSSPPVAEVANLQLHSAFWPNLHHTLHAAGMPGGRQLDSPVTTSLTGSMTDAERRGWEAAVSYYAREVSPKDLRTGARMTEINDALAASGDALRPDGALTTDHVTALQAAASAYRRVLWPEHDKANRAWIRDVARRLEQIAPAVLPRLSRVYATPWFSKPVRIDITYHGRAYTYLRPNVHAMLASGAPAYGGWAGAEMVLHEVSHALVDRLSVEIDRHGAAGAPDSRDWHLALFYMVGEITRQAIAQRGEAYTPFLFAAGVIDRGWPGQRALLETRLKRYVDDEKMSMDAGIRMWLAPTLFAFRIGMWNNLHQFLYVLGRASNGAPDMRREAVAAAPGDVEGLSARPDEERAAWEEAIRFYAAGLSRKDAVFDADMVKVTQALTGAPDTSNLSGLGLDPQLVAVLNRVGPVYRAVWWPRHGRASRERRDELAALAEKHGAALVKRLTAVLGTEWPSQPRMIDLAAYANWSGAYSTDGGLIVVSSTSESNMGLWGLETLLHEAAHQWDEQFERRLSAAAAKTGKPLPAQLSHALIFHTCGELMRELFPDHVPSADKVGVWNRGLGSFKTPLDRHWRPYLRGATTFDDAIAAILTSLR